MKNNTCTICGAKGIPGLISGAGKCQAHWNNVMFGTPIPKTNKMIPEYKTTLADLYLEFINDFLTIERYAEYLDISVTQCRALVDLGSEFHNERVSE